MTTIQKIFGLVSGLFFGVVGAIAFVTLFLGAVSYWIGGRELVEARFFTGSNSPGLAVAEWVGLIMGLSIGFGFGVIVWSFIFTRSGWFTWEEILELLKG